MKGGFNVSDLEKHLSELMEDQEFADEYNALEDAKKAPCVDTEP